MEAIIGGKAVIERWSDYRTAYETARGAYRDAYREAYETVQREVEATVQAIKRGSAYQEAPVDQRDLVLDKIFGAGGPCAYPDITLGSASGAPRCHGQAQPDRTVAGAHGLAWVPQSCRSDIA